MARYLICSLCLCFSTLLPACGDDTRSPTLERAKDPAVILNVDAAFGPKDQSSKFASLYTDKAVNALLEAAQAGDLDAMQMAINNGADINSPAPDTDANPLMLYLAYVRPVRVDVVEKFLQLGADPARPAANGATTLDALAKADDPQIVPLFLAAGVSPDSQLTAGGRTWLTTTITNKNNVQLAQLLEAGANPNLASTATGLHPFHQAVMGTNWEAAALLLDHGADPRRGDPELKQTLWAIEKDLPNFVDDKKTQTAIKHVRQWIDSQPTD